MRFASLASGSRGNALLVEHDATLVLVDCGIGERTIAQRMRKLGRQPSDITALLLTHEHSDHVRGVTSFARRHRVPVFSTAGTAAAASLTGLAQLHVFSCRAPLEIGSLRIEPFTVPHDAREPCQFAFGGAGRRLGVLTDTGHVTTHVRERLSRCDALALEFNHDIDVLWNGTYPESVKQRIASPLGHLNNTQAADLLRTLDGGELQWVMALHMSEANNTPESVESTIRSVLGEAHSASTHRALQDESSGWFEID